MRYTSGIHVARDQAWAEKEGTRFPARRAKPHKLRINVGELAELQAPAEEPEPEAEPEPIEIHITRKE